MKHFGTVSFVLFALCLSFALLFQSAAKAQQSSKTGDTRPKGQLRGKLYDPDGYVAQKAGAFVSLKLNGEALWEAYRPIRDFSEGEYYYFKDLKPGVYDMYIVGSTINNARPMHIYGIIVKAGKPTILDDIEMKKGDTLLEIGKPTILPDPAIIVAEKLAELQKQIDDLKKENADFKKQIEDIKKK